jgi:hypothetical protein
MAPENEAAVVRLKGRSAALAVSRSGLQLFGLMERKGFGTGGPTPAFKWRDFPPP